MTLRFRTLRRLHLCVDALLVSAGWLGAWALRFALNDPLDRDINPSSAYLMALPLVVACWTGAGLLFGVYRVARFATVVDQFRALLRGTLGGLLAVSSVAFFVKEFDFGRSVVLLSAALDFGLLSASRLVFFRLESRLRRRGVCDLRAAIVGTGVTAMRLMQKLQDHPEIGYEVVGFLDEDPELVGEEVAGCPVLGRLEDLRKVAAEQRLDEVFIARPELPHARMLSLTLSCEDLGLTFRVATDLFQVLTAGTPVDLVEDLPLVRLGRERVHPLYEPAKRAFDVVAASLALFAALPLWAFCVACIRRSSPGPALFCQERVGLHGRSFPMFKFRTMAADADPFAPSPRGVDDPRITRTGRWLRRTSLDELPQLLNVLRGEMSLVGPRPEMPFIAATYDEWQRRRLSVKPGVTGLWQVLGRKDLPMASNLQYDFYYIRNRSFLMDLSILMRTVGVVLARRGAY